MTTMRARTDLRGRRRATGATVKAMAAGIGLRAAEIREIEALQASEGMLEHYARWLDRIEAWPAEKRARELLAASDGRRFNP